MDDVNRKKLDEELTRLHGKLKLLEPDTEKYKAISERIVNLSELANRDDESRNRYDIDQQKLDAEANAEAARRGVETEKLQLERDIAEAEEKRKEKEARRSWIPVAISGAVTVFTFAGTWWMNRVSQNQAEYFESTGHAYTSKAGKWQMKEPQHPNPLLRSTK